MNPEDAYIIAALFLFASGSPVSGSIAVSFAVVCIAAQIFKH